MTGWVYWHLRMHLHIPAMHIDIDSIKQTSEKRGLEEQDLTRVTSWQR